MQDNLHQFKVMDTQISKQKDSAIQILLTLMLAVAIACFLIVPITNYLIKSTYETSVSSAYQNIKTRALSKFSILESQTSSFFDYANAIVNSDTIKILLTDYNLDPQNELFQAQKPYIQRTLHEFVEYNKEIVSAKLLSNNNVISEYSAYSFVEPDVLTFTHEDSRAVSSPIIDKNRVFVDVLINIADLNDTEKQQYVGQLVYRLDITGKLSKIIKTNEYSLNGATASLVGHNKQLIIQNGIFLNQEIEPVGKADKFEKYNLLTDLNLTKFIFQTKQNSFGYQVRYDYKINKALKDYINFRSNAFVYSGLLTAVISLFVLALFWKSKNNKTRLLAKQYSGFAKEINKKQTMLEGINKTIDEHISLKNLKGQYLYANKAFSKFFDIRFSNRKTTDNDFILSKKLIEMFAKADEKVAKSSNPWHKDQLEIAHPDGTRFFDVTKWPQKDGENVTGIITIARDRTEPILHQREMEKLQNQSIQALVKTVEIKDPHLAGHHARMAYVAELMAKKLKLDDNDILTLSYSAKLAGVGKVFVPQALLTKPGKLTSDELEIIQTHVVSAKLVLEQIDFSLPIVQTIENMYERLDGSGYPKGKKAEEIAQPSRILAIADAFCALIVPRSYRDGIDFDEAIKLLQKQDGKYDSAILIILQEIIAKMPDVRKEFIINLK
tara:strand:+ start:3655 stop:5655 length:2001 start_codon:yes stop_codon:yes gene_type:complete